MANPNFWYARRYKDYAEKTAHLSLIEHGAYTLLLDHYYESRSKSQAFALANGEANLNALFRVCRSQADDERDAIRSVVAQFFYIGEDGYLHNASADRELAKAANVSAARSEAGKEGAEKKKRKRETQAIDIAIDIAIAEANEQANASANDQQTATHTHTQIHTQPQQHQPLQPLEVGKPVVEARGSRLPPDWKPSQEDITFCQKTRPDLEVAEVASRFRDFWSALPGSKGRKTDWVATWRNWVRNEKQGNRRAPTTTPSRHSGFDSIDYSQGISKNGEII